MEFGTAVHTAVFEPERFSETVVVMPEIERRSKAGKEEYAEFMKNHEGKTVIADVEFEACKLILESAQKHKILGKLLKEKGGKYEVSGFFPYKDEPCKFRTDFVLPEQKIILDLKTTKAGNERAFRNSVLDFCYHSQAAFYLTGMGEITGEPWTDFLWIAIESSPPYKIYLYEPDTKWLLEGHKLCSAAIDLYRECSSNKAYPSVVEEITILSAPAWIGN
jgi:exodeoxyribonuclease VIII